MACRPGRREQAIPSSGASCVTVTSDTSALANTLQNELNARALPTRSQSQPVDLALPISGSQYSQRYQLQQPPPHQHQPQHAWCSQSSAAFRRDEFRGGFVKSLFFIFTKLFLLLIRKVIFSAISRHFINLTWTRLQLV